MREYLAKLKSDKGSSTIISTLMVTILLVSLIITAFDTSFYFTNRSAINTVARDGARTVAIMGGNGTASTATVIEKQYGADRDTACSNAKIGRFGKAATDASTAIECNMIAALNDSNALVSVTVESVKCNPTATAKVGTRTECAISYSYKGLPGAPLNFIKTRNADGATSGLLSSNLVKVSSSSEVALGSGDIVAR